MKRTRKRWASFLLVLLILLQSMGSLPVYAADAVQAVSSSSGQAPADEITALPEGEEDASGQVLSPKEGSLTAEGAENASEGGQQEEISAGSGKDLGEGQEAAPGEAKSAPEDKKKADGDDAAADPSDKKEDPSKDEEEKQKLIDQELNARIYADKSYDREVSDGGLVIRLSGQMPKGAVVRAYPVDITVAGEKPLFAYDITIFDREEKPFEPEDSSIRVTFRSSELEKIDKADVFHMKDETAEPEKVADSLKPNDGAVAFQADSFSIYVIMDETKIYYRTYNFYDEDGVTLIHTVKLKEGEALKKPGTPARDGEIFDDWYTSPTYDRHFVDFGTVDHVDADETINVYARYRHVYHVYYKAEDRQPTEADPVLVYYTQSYEVGKNDYLNYENVPYPVKEGEALVGWSLTPGGGDLVQNLTMKVDRDIRLFPIVKKAYWVTYESNGGSFLPPVYVLENNVTVEPPEPTRTGYSFAGWYKDRALQNRYSFGQKLTGNITLYAKWTPARTGYQVIFWQQRPTDSPDAADGDKTYWYAGSERRYATTGDTVSLRNSGTNRDDRRNEWDTHFFHFHYNKQKEEAKVLEADGSTIINVYYDRDVIYMAFTERFWSSASAPRYGKNSVGVYIDAPREKVIKGLYGASFQETGVRWPDPPQNSRWFSYYLSNGRPQSLGITFLNAFIDESGLMEPAAKYVRDPSTGNWERTSNLMIFYPERQSASLVIKHYTENLNGGWDEAISVNSGAGLFTFTNKFEGFTFHGYMRDYNWEWERYGYRDDTSILIVNNGSSIRNLNRLDELDIYHKRNSYNLEYATAADGKTIARYTESVPYETLLGDLYNKPDPGKPLNIQGEFFYPDYYDFAGWYTDPEGTSPFNFDGSVRMPAHEQKLYAVWKPRKIHVTLNFDNGDPNQAFDKEAGQKLDRPPTPTKTDYVFAGWVHEGSGTPFNFNEVLVKDTHLKARWVTTKAYQTHYVANYPPGSVPPDAGGQVPDDRADGPRLYVPGAMARVVGINPNWNWKKPADDREFLYWNTSPDDKGDRYYPGVDIEMAHDHVTLYAIWSDPLKPHLIYDLNYDSAPDGLPRQTTIQVDNNTVWEVGSVQTKGDKQMETYTNRRRGYRFMGWSHYPDGREGSDNWLQNGETVGINRENQDVENILYAQWKRVIDVSIDTETRGNMADKKKRFRYLYTLDHADSGYHDEGEFTVADDDGRVEPGPLHDLLEGTVVTVTMVDAGSEGYENVEHRDLEHSSPDQTTTTPATGGQAMKWTYTVTGNSYDHYLTFVVTRSAVAPTNLPVESVQWILVLVLTGAAFFSFLVLGRGRKKTRDTGR